MHNLEIKTGGVTPAPEGLVDGVRSGGRVRAGGVRAGAVLIGAAVGLVLHAIMPAEAGIAQAMLLGALLVAAADSDLRAGRIPNALTGAAAAAGAALLLISPHPGLGAGLAGSLAGALLLLGVRGAGSLFLGRPGMGMGDVKLAAVLGLLLGPHVLWALYLAIVLGGLAAAVTTVLGGPGRRRAIVFAPFIALGVFAAVYVLPFEAAWHFLTAASLP